MTESDLHALRAMAESLIKGELALELMKVGVLLILNLLAIQITLGVIFLRLGAIHRTMQKGPQ